MVALDEIAKAVNSRLFAAPDRQEDVYAAAVLTRFLSDFGIADFEVIPVRTLAMRDDRVPEFLEQGPSAFTDNDDGVSDSKPPFDVPPGAWAGHLIVRAGNFGIDATAGKFSRPGNGAAESAGNNVGKPLEVPEVHVFELSEAFLQGGEQDWAGTQFEELGSAILYHRDPPTELPFERWPVWDDEDTIASIVDFVKQEVERLQALQDGRDATDDPDDLGPATDSGTDPPLRDGSGPGVAQELPADEPVAPTLEDSDVDGASPTWGGDAEQAQIARQSGRVAPQDPKADDRDSPRRVLEEVAEFDEVAGAGADAVDPVLGLGLDPM